MKTTRNILLVIPALAGILSGIGASAETPVFLQAGAGPDLVQEILKAKSLLQEGWNTWDQDKMKNARDLFLNLILQEKAGPADLFYYAALSDYRLSVHAFASGKSSEAEFVIAEAKKYLEKVMELEPDRGEPYALCAALMGFEIALNPSRGMELGMQTLNYFNLALDKEPLNPRVRLLKGQSVLYWPPEYGGGPDNAISLLNEALSLFEKDQPADPVKPDWGQEEALTSLARAYLQKGERDKALEALKKALEVNPDFGLAREELKRLQAEK